MVMGGVALVLLAVLGGVAMRGGSPGMGFLYTDLDPAAAQAITEKLKAADVPFQLSADGTSVMAPQDKLAELRMSMAADRLGGKIGYEVLDEEEPFGVSASRARINENRAAEGELAKSIESLDSVSRARVHLVLPERAMFAPEPRRASAAVTVKTRGRLPRETIEAIRYLVASSVPELAPEAVSIIDQSGALLARAGEAGEAGASQADERQIAVEARLRTQIEELLEPIVGEGKVRAEVAAQIDRDQTREEANVFDPDKQVVAHQINVQSNDLNSENAPPPQGASVAAQLPEAQGQAASMPRDTRTAQRGETSEDTTYENSQTRSVTIRAPGKVTRLTVAVMIDGGKKGLPQPQIKRLTRLVENAVGADSQRGDNVVIESMEFSAGDPLADAEDGLFSTLSIDQLVSFAELLMIAVVGLIALRMLRPRAELALPGGAAGALGGPTGAEMFALAGQTADGSAAGRELEAAPDTSVPLLDQEIALAQVDGRVKLSALKRIGDAISDNPGEAASVIRQWMNS